MSHSSCFSGNPGHEKGQVVREKRFGSLANQDSAGMR